MFLNPTVLRIANEIELRHAHTPLFRTCENVFFNVSSYSDRIHALMN